MTEFLENPEARFFGYSDARNYDRCDALQYGYSSDSQGEYYEGYAQGMDVNIEVDNGIAPEEDRNYGVRFVRRQYDSQHAEITG